MQVYQGLDIITNKHPIAEREGIPHHVIDHVSWSEEYFIHRFAEEATAAIDSIHSRGKTPIIVGGTHYYLQKLLFRNKTIEDEHRKPLTEQQTAVLDGPVEGILKELRKHDPVIAQKFHPQDKRKLRRALEIWYTLGERPSELYREQKLDELEDSSLIYNTLLFWLYSEREVLQSRLDERVDQMIEGGAIDEVQQMYEYYQKQQPTPSLTNGIWQVIGFKEFLPWLAGKGTSRGGHEGADSNADSVAAQKLFEEGVERMKIRTRQYAKYQIKWIKKLLSVELQKEARFGFKYGGKLYLLNATDLNEWEAEVQERGLSIAQQFVQHGPNGVSVPQKPESVQEDIFPDETAVRQFNSNKRLESVKNWQHFTCDHCYDKQGQKLVAVGEEAWEAHLNSRRHKKNVKYGDRRRPGGREIPIPGRKITLAGRETLPGTTEDGCT